MGDDRVVSANLIACPGFECLAVQGTSWRDHQRHGGDDWHRPWLCIWRSDAGI